MRINFKFSVVIMIIACIALAGCNNSDNEIFEEQPTVLKLLKSRTNYSMNYNTGEYQTTEDIYSYDSDWRQQSIKTYIDGALDSENTYIYDANGNPLHYEQVSASGVVLQSADYECYVDGTIKSVERTSQNANSTSYAYSEYLPDGRIKSSFSHSTSVNTNYGTTENQSSSIYSYEGEEQRCVSENIMKQDGTVIRDVRGYYVSAPLYWTQCYYYKNNGEWEFNDSTVTIYNEDGRIKECVMYDSHKKVTSDLKYGYTISGLTETRNIYESYGDVLELLNSTVTDYCDIEHKKIKKQIQRSFIGSVESLQETEYTWDGDNYERITKQNGNYVSKTTYVQTEIRTESNTYTYQEGDWVMTSKSTLEYIIVNK